MRWSRSFGDADCSDHINFETVNAAIGNVRAVSDLHSLRRKRLVLLLIESRIIYEIFRKQDTTVSPKTSSAKIKNLLGSLSLLSTFSQAAGMDPDSRGEEADPASRDAMLRMLWTADSLGAAERQSVMDLFSAASAVYKVAKEAERTMALHIRRKEAETAIVWLCGRRLPDIYYKIFGAKLTTTRGNNLGIDFIQAALRTIKVRDTISDETIISHYKAAQRVSAS
jgi:hypothetical protein